MAIPNTLPFQYQIRGNAMQYLDGHDHARAVETRDIELEDYLGRMGVTPWTTLPLLNSWTSYDGAVGRVPTYRRVGDMTMLRGVVRTPGGAASTAIIGQVPLGFRSPYSIQSFAVNADGVAKLIQTNADGTIQPIGGVTINTYCFLDGISWSTSV